jgi:hypothetical protein
MTDSYDQFWLKDGLGDAHSWKLGIREFSKQVAPIAAGQRNISRRDVELG